MKKKFMWLLMSVMILMNSFPVHASTLTNEVPDFEDYTTLEGINLDDYPYYYIYVSERTDKIVYVGIFSKTVCHLNKNDGTYDMAADTYPYFVDLALDDAFYFDIVFDLEGNYISHRSVSCPSSYSNLRFWFTAPVSMLYSNYNVFLLNNGAVTSFFHVAPLSQGQKVTIGTTISHQSMIQPILKMIVGLVPLVIGLIVFSVGLRKAWGMLSQLLHQA